MSEWLRGGTRVSVLGANPLRSSPILSVPLTKELQKVMISIMYDTTILHREDIMGAIAVSKEDEGQISELMRELGVKSKAQVVRAALRTLRERINQERLRSEIRESVKRCAEADRRENRLLAPGGVTRSE